MQDEFLDQFDILREEFRLLQGGFRFESAMKEQPLKSSWVGSALLNANEGKTDTGSTLALLSRCPSPFKSFESSHSSTESARAQSETTTTTSASRSDDLADPSRRHHRDITENAEKPLDGSTGSSRSRKGHKKSRDGCFNCKRRKIKCQETQPGCENCSKKNLQCSYPAPKTLKALQGSLLYSSNPIASVNLQGTPTIFSLTDMRLFHHFLIDAYPHLPVGNDSAWLYQVPLIAHHNEYLMHAILGMSASHLELLTGEPLSTIAIHHRLLAVQGSNAAISVKTRTGSDGDALLGACYLLAFQASYMRDGLFEFFTMIRGCSLLNIQLKKEKLHMAFFLTEKDHFHFMEERLLNLPVISSELVKGAQNSLAAVQPLCTLPCHTDLYRLLHECIEAIRISSLRAYFKFISIFQGIIQMPPSAFATFMSPTNTISHILIANFLALQLVVAPIINREWAGRDRSTPLRNHLDQIYRLAKGVEEGCESYMEWPLSIADAVFEEIAGNEAVLPRVPILRREWVGVKSDDSRCA